MVMENASRLSGDVASYKSPSKDNTGIRVDSGPYVAIVKNNIDPARMGRLEVLIPSLVGKGLAGTQTQLIICEYLSPFYGAKTTRYVDQSNPASYKASQHSYGMWMVPPDIDTKVLVIFAEGDMSQAYWIGCVVEPFLNQMTPGIGALDQTMTEPEASEGSYAGSAKQAIYGTDTLPAGEVNRSYSEATGESAKDGRKRYPIHPSAEILRQQGLVGDPIRGTTTSSARRESPSAVFGISTPGRKDLSSSPKNIGATDSVRTDIVDRLVGHTFVLDDGDKNGNNQLVRLRSASGHQLLLNDSAGVVYLANASGNTWMEFSANGSIDIYSGGNVSLRARGDINYHSDGNINMFAHNDIKLSAARKLVLDGYAIQNYADQDISFQATTGSIVNKAPVGSFITDVGQNIMQQSIGVQHLIGSQIHFNSVGRVNDLVKTIERTSVLDPSGTGTKREYIPDVNPVAKFLLRPIEVSPIGTVSMSGMRVPTHEPYPYHYDKVISFAGYEPDSNSSVPGTAQFVAQRNRTSDNPTVRIGQFQADLQAYMEKQGYSLSGAVNKLTGSIEAGTGNIASPTLAKLQSAADQFTKDYNKLYALLDSGPFKLSPISAGISEAVEQTIQTITGSTLDQLKDKVFINQGGKILSAVNLGKEITGDVQRVFGDLSEINKIKTTTGNVLNKTLELESLNKVFSGAGSLNIPDMPDLAISLGDTKVNDILFGQKALGDFDTGTQGIFGTGGSVNIDLSKLTTNLASDQLNAIIGRSSKLSNIADIGMSAANTFKSINDITGGKAGEIGKDILFGKGPLGDFDTGTKGIFGSYGQAGIGGILSNTFKNFQGGAVTAVTKVSSLVSNFGSSFSSTIASVASSIGKLFSDARLKENVIKIDSYNNVNFYEYNYTFNKTQRFVGVMAQEILQSKYSECVELDSTGYYKVDYTQLLERLNGGRN